MPPQDRRGMKLIDLIMVILVIGFGIVLLPPLFYSSRSTGGRQTQCANNMRHLGLALINFSTSKNRFPNAGTFHDDPAEHGGDPTKSKVYLSLMGSEQPSDLAESWLYNWVVEILPYLDQQDLANAWDRAAPYWSPTSPGANDPSNLAISSTSIEVLRCPNDPTFVSNQGNLSYVVNGGFVRWPAIPVSWVGSPNDGEAHNGEVLQWAPSGRSWQESQAVGKKLGVMFLGTETGDQPWDLKTTAADLSDGAGSTLLLAENTLAGFSTGNDYSGLRATNWACPLPNFVMFMGSDNVCASKRSPVDCLGGQLTPRSAQEDGPGWALANRAGTYENIGFAQKLTVKGSFPFANSGHPGGANYVVCDGAVRYISNSIDGAVYAKLITPAGERLPSALRQGPFSGELEFD